MLFVFLIYVIICGMHVFFMVVSFIPGVRKLIALKEIHTKESETTFHNSKIRSVARTVQA